MRIAKLSDTVLESSNVAASSLSEYDSGATYSQGNQVKVSYKSDGTTSRTPVEEYESITGNTKYPPDNPSDWSLLGASNRWKMFDNFTNTQTTNTEIIDVSVEADKRDIVGLFRLQAKTVTLELVSSGETKQSATFDLRTQTEPGWYSYLFENYEYEEDILWSYSNYNDATLKATIEYYTGENAKCGTMVTGKQIQLGKTEYEPSVGIIDYSKKDTDNLGRTYLKQGSFAKRADITAWLYNQQVDTVRRALTKVRGEPFIFDGNNDSNCPTFSSLIIYGYFREFDITIPGPVISRCSIDIEGLT